MSDITEKEEAMLRTRLEEGERRWNAAETTFRMHQKTPPMADTWDDVAERRAAVEAARIAVLESPAAMAERHRAQGTQPEQTIAGVWHGLAELDRRLDAMEAEAATQKAIRLSQRSSDPGVYQCIDELGRRLDVVETEIQRATAPTITVHRPDEAIERQFIAHGARLERAEIATLIRVQASKATGRGQNRLKAELHLIAKLIEERDR